MPRNSSVFRNRLYECPACGVKEKRWAWEYSIFAHVCGKTMNEVEEYVAHAHSVVPEGIPGGVYIRHGLCNPDGSPRRYDSRSEIRAEAKKRGLVMDDASNWK